MDATKPLGSEPPPAPAARKRTVEAEDGEGLVRHLVQRFDVVVRQVEQLQVRSRVHLAQHGGQPIVLKVQGQQVLQRTQGLHTGARELVARGVDVAQVLKLLETAQIRNVGVLQKPSAKFVAMSNPACAAA